MMRSPVECPSVSLYHLKRVDIDDADAAPAHALLDGQERLQPLHEPVEVQQLGLRVAVRLLGQVGDHFLEIAGDVADRDVLLGQLVLQPLHLRGKPLGQGPDGLVLGLLDQLALPGDDVLDHREERRRRVSRRGRGARGPTAAGRQWFGGLRRYRRRVGYGLGHGHGATMHIKRCAVAVAVILQAIAAGCAMGLADSARLYGSSATAFRQSGGRSRATTTVTSSRRRLKSRYRTPAIDAWRTAA